MRLLVWSTLASPSLSRQNRCFLLRCLHPWIQWILCEYLGVRKICSRRIPHKNLLNLYTWDKIWIYSYRSKQYSVVWVFDNEPNPTKVVYSRINSKEKLAFFGCTGHVITVPLEDRRTVDAEGNIKISLPTVFNKIQKINEQRKGIFHETIEYLKKKNIEGLIHIHLIYH